CRGVPTCNGYNDIASLRGARSGRVLASDPVGRGVGAEVGMRMIGDEAGPNARGLVRGLREAMARWLPGRISSEAQPAGSDEPRPRFRVVCIAREAGAGGSALGRMVAERLG